MTRVRCFGLDVSVVETPGNSPQGGMNPGESPEEAMYRELWEEIGLKEDAVAVQACTRGWLRYRLPRRMLRRQEGSPFVGQKQKWFLLRMIGDDSAVRALIVR